MMFDLAPLTAAMLIAVLAIVLWLSLRADLTEYATFKLVTDSQERCSYFRRWILRGTLLFTGSTLLILMQTSRLAAIVTIPTEFAELASNLALLLDGLLTTAALLGFTTGVAILVVAVAVRRMMRTKETPVQIVVGDIQALLPRNRTERIWAAALAVNAGITEELFFRLLLPLLLHSITGNAVVAFATAALLFGLMHLYQGVAGVAATTLLGCGLTVLYLGTGQLWLAILVHAALDLNSLLLMPALGALMQRWWRPKDAHASNAAGIDDG